MMSTEEREDYWAALLRFVDAQVAGKSNKQKAKSKSQKTEKPKPAYWFASDKIRFHKDGDTSTILRRAPPPPSWSPDWGEYEDTRERFADGYDRTEVDTSGLDLGDEDVATWVERLSDL